MYSRRDFLRLASLAGGAVALKPDFILAARRTSHYFGLNTFIENHPDAVFILRTSVDAKTNASALRDVSHQLGTTMFVVRPDAEESYSTDTNIIIKPNLTSWSWDKPPIEDVMGIQTDVNFTDGLIASLNDVSIGTNSIYIRDGNYSSVRSDGTLYKNLALRTGINLKDLSAGIGSIGEGDLQWLEVPGGVWFKRIGYLWPVNAQGSCLINIAKFKSHSMGMTLCSKNLQGTNAQPYIRHCTGWGLDMGMDSNDVATDAFKTIQANYDSHTKAGIPRWDLPGATSGGLWMETHATRCLDNNSTLHPLINIIEGVYGREGSFVSGPSDNGGYGRDILTNVVIFGKNARHVDLIGTYLAGHEPGNFGFFHLAVERGLSSYLNPLDVPLFEWRLDGSTTVSTLDKFTRTPIRTPYLRKAGEDEYHMVDEAYDYSTTSVTVKRPHLTPDVFALSQNFPNPFNPSTSIQYYIPKSGHARLEVFTVLGERVETLVDASVAAGDHVAVWDAHASQSGTYFVRLLFNGYSKVRKMVLVR